MDTEQLAKKVAEAAFRELAREYKNAVGEFMDKDYRHELQTYTGDELEMVTTSYVQHLGYGGGSRLVAYANSYDPTNDNLQLKYVIDFAEGEMRPVKVINRDIPTSALLVGMVSWDAAGERPSAPDINERLADGATWTWYWESGSDMYHLAFFRRPVLTSLARQLCEEAWGG